MAFGLTGACCLPNGNCTEDISMRDCEAQSGTYQGDDSTCTPDSCVRGVPFR